MKYEIQYPSEPLETADCHDRRFVKTPTGHPVAIKTLERLGCTVRPIAPQAEGDPLRDLIAAVERFKKEVGDVR